MTLGRETLSHATVYVSARSAMRRSPMACVAAGGGGGGAVLSQADHGAPQPLCSRELQRKAAALLRYAVVGRGMEPFTPLEL